MALEFWFVRNFDHDTGAPCFELWQERVGQSPKINGLLYSEEIAKKVCNLLNGVKAP